jgi:hypothetical protein
MFHNTPPRNHNPRNPRIGRVRRGITRAFIAGGGRDLTTSELLQWSHALELYRGASLRQRHPKKRINRIIFFVQDHILDMNPKPSRFDY